jgi:radical SAM superfamily enzyme YgiQ (UPF0313 family)
MPPALVHMPSPALNILKSVLNQNQLFTEIIYWNIKFEQFHFDWVKLFENDYFELGRVLPFIYSFSKQYNDIEIQKKIRHLLAITYKSSKFYSKDRKTKYYSELPDKTHDQLTDYITRELEKVDFSEVIISGFTAKFFQWIPALKTAELTKKIHPQVKTVIGGFDSKDSATEMLRCFECFDYAVWGEGEYPLLELTRALIENSSDFGNISGLVYREADKIIISEKKGRKFYDLDHYPKADCDDFFAVAIGTDVNYACWATAINTGKGILTV